MNHTRLLIFGALLVSVCSGARRVDLQDRLDAGRQRRLVELLRRRALGEEVRRSGDSEEPEKFLNLGKEEKLERKDYLINKAGHIQIKFQETYQGVPIIGETVVLEKDGYGQYTGIYGRLIEDLKEDVPSVEPRLSKQEILNIATRQAGDDIDEIQVNFDKDIALQIFMEKLGDEYKATLVYKLSYIIETDSMISRPFFIIDANEGTLIDKWEGINMHRPRETEYTLVNGIGGNEKIGKYYYGTNGKYPQLRVAKSEDGKCLLENEHVKVFDMNSTHGFDDALDKGYGHKFDCIEGNQDTVNGGYSALNDVFYFSNVVHDMYMEWFGTPPMKGVISSKVHYGKDMVNAFWYGGYAQFGDGDSTSKFIHPLTSLDIVAHEIAHGITEENSNLRYAGQSGGLNEAFSDMTSVAAEHYLGMTDWESGREVTNCGSLRYFYDPPLDKMSIDHADKFCPFIDVHYSSGVFNKASYLLSNTKGWDIETAFRAFHTANKMYWHEDSDFADAACGVVKATKDIGKPAKDVTDVFRKVGITPCVSSNPRSYDIRGNENGTSIYKIGSDEFDVILAFGPSKIILHLLSKEGSVIKNYTTAYFTSFKLNTTSEEKASAVRISSPGGTFRHWSLISYSSAERHDIAETVVGNESRSLSFQLADDFFSGHTDDTDMLVIAEITPPVNGTSAESTLYMRYDQPLDTKKREYDYKAFTLGENSLGIYACRPRPGVYHLKLGSYEPGNSVKLFYAPTKFLEQTPN